MVSTFMASSRSALAVALLLVLHPSWTAADSGGRWFMFGHRIVARIAEARLTPRATAAVREILGGQSLADVSSWADLVREARPHTKWWHFVNIPLHAAAYDSARDCPRGCIISAIATERADLADPSTTAADRAEALRYLVHFIGDLHQPLHTADNSDRGGTRRVVWLGADSTDLHKVWDGQILERSGVSMSSDAAYLDALRRAMDTLDLTALEAGTVLDWAMEGHGLAETYVYRIPRGGRIGDAYVHANRGVVDRAIIAAGVRLAKVLNEALASYQPRSATSPGTMAALPEGVRPTTPVYPDREAAAHVGETAMVVGTVVSVRRSKAGTVYLNLGADYPRQPFSGTILQPTEAWPRGLDSLRGRRIGVRGRIAVHQGRVQIVIERPDQLVWPLPEGSPPGR
jgi:nuclease S1